MKDLFTQLNYPISGTDLLPTLIQDRGYKCECCGLSEWNGKKIPLQVHHGDGDRCNNRKSNLSLLCPNCHAQTENFSRRKGQKDKVTDEMILDMVGKCDSIHQVLLNCGLSTAGVNYERVRVILWKNNISKFNKPKSKVDEQDVRCEDCGKPISPGSVRCKACENRHRGKDKVVSREELKSLIRTTPFTTIGKKFNVSDNAIRKWCRYYNLPDTKNMIKKFSDDEWKNL